MGKKKPNTARTAWGTAASLTAPLSRPAARALTEALTDLNIPPTTLAAQVITAELAPRTSLSTEQARLIDDALEQIASTTKASRWPRFSARVLRSQLPELYSCITSVGSLTVKPDDAKAWSEATPCDLAITSHWNEPSESRPYRLTDKCREENVWLDVLFNRKKESATRKPNRIEKSRLSPPATTSNWNNVSYRITERSSAYLFGNNDLVALGCRNSPVLENVPIRNNNIPSTPAQFAMARINELQNDRIVDGVNDGYVPTAGDTLFVRRQKREARRQRKMQEEREKTRKELERKEKEKEKARQERKRRIEKRKKILSVKEQQSRINDDVLLDEYGGLSDDIENHTSVKRFISRPVSPPSKKGMLSASSSVKSQQPEIIDLTGEEEEMSPSPNVSSPVQSVAMSNKGDEYKRAVGEYEKNLTPRDAALIRKFLLERGVLIATLFHGEVMMEFVLDESRGSTLVLRLTPDGRWRRVRYTSQ